MFSFQSIANVINDLIEQGFTEEDAYKFLFGDPEEDNTSELEQYTARNFY